MTLSPRQRQVVQLVAQGYSYAKVARHLGIKERTVRMHVEHIALKLSGEESPLRRVLLHSARLLAA